MIEDTSLKVTPDLTCSYSGSTTITYSITNYLTQAPSWVSINSISGQLSISAPSVTADTTYSFYINSAVSGSSTQKLISVTVLNWAVKSCSACSSSPSICSTCNYNYNLTTSGTCLINTASETAKAQATTSQATTGAVSWVTSFSGLSNISSLGNLWAMLGQIQLQWFTIRLLIFNWVKVGQTRERTCNALSSEFNNWIYDIVLFFIFNDEYLLKLII